MDSWGRSGSADARVQDVVMVKLVKLAGCCNGTRNCYMSKDQGKFDFSCHDPFNWKISLPKSHNAVLLFYCFQAFYKKHPYSSLIFECETASNHIVLL